MHCYTLLSLNDGLDIDGGSESLQVHELKEPFYGFRERAEAVAEFFLDFLDLGAVSDLGEALVQGEAGGKVLDVGLGDVGRHRELDSGQFNGLDRFGGIGGVLLGGEFADRFLKQLAVEGEADGVNLSALGSTEEIAGASDFHIPHGDTEAGAEFRGFEDGLDALFRRFGDALVAGDEEVGVGAMLTPADATAELVELGQAEAVGAVDDDGVDVGHIQAGLDDGSANENVSFVAAESVHDVFQIGLGHLAVAYDDAGLGNEFSKVSSGLVDSANAVVEEEDLSAALHLPEDGFTYNIVVILGDEGLHRKAGPREGCG